MGRKNQPKGCVIFCSLIFAALGGCQKADETLCDGDPVEITRPSNWTRASHCRGVVPDYDRVFDDTIVHRFDISMSEKDHNAMTDNLDTLVWNSILPSDLDDLDSPIQVPVDVTVDGVLWTAVAMRWKGHSSLIGAWKAPIQKLSFVLTFDHFEEAIPNIENQRFYGFKRLIFANGYTDQSFIREKVASEIFRELDIPVVRTAFTQVYLTIGDESKYLGLYTMMEDPADEMLEEQFGYYNNLVGNLYKPWGQAARWRDPDEDTDSDDPQWWKEDIEEHFEKCTNEEIADWSDVMKAIEKLHKDRYSPVQWRADLETVFDVQSFVKTLAVSQTIMNWDSYGCMHHNYYLYANPLDHGRLVWFPWDLGETMSNRQDETCPDLDGVMFDEIVNSDPNSGIDTYWPLVEFLLSDDVYRSAYKESLRDVLEGPFAKQKIFKKMETYHDLIAPYIVGPKAVEQYPYTTCEPHDCSAFNTSLTEGDGALKPLVEARHAAVSAALEE